MLKAVAKNILSTVGLAQVGVFLGYLRLSGWFKSLRLGRPVASDGSPLPWYSYPFLYFLQMQLADNRCADIRLFEFGSGQSTLWWARKVREVVSVEDVPAWYNYVSPGLPENVNYHFATTQQEYLGALSDAQGLFDIIVVDGSHREWAILAVTKKLSDRGVVIVDNADWSELQSPLATMVSNGFRRLDFYGLGPVNGHPWSTAVLYRPGNLFEI